MSTTKTPTASAALFNDGVYDYVKQNMSNSQVKLNDSVVPHLVELVAAICSSRARTDIPFTTHGLPPFAAERKYKSEDGLRLKIINDTSFIILTPLLCFTIVKHADEVIAMTHPLVDTTPDEDDIRIMAVALVDMGTLILNTINPKSK